MPDGHVCTSQGCYGLMCFKSLSNVVVWALKQADARRTLPRGSGSLSLLLVQKPEYRQTLDPWLVQMGRLGSDLVQMGRFGSG